jgi:hypothetical protein
MKKEYNRKTKKWEETTGQGKFKTRDSCKGHREHDYILALPPYFAISGIITDDIKPQAITEYYASEERREQFNNAEDAKLLALGLNMGKRYKSWARSKFYRCVACNKQKYD